MSRREPAPAVGLVLVAGGAIVAVACRDPLRLAAVADVNWPREPEVSPVARRMLARTRRRLGLPRWQPVNVVLGPSVAGPGYDPAGLLASTAVLLARAGLAQAAVLAPERAGTLCRTPGVIIDPRLAPLMAGEAGLAAGAAIAALLSNTVDVSGLVDQTEATGRIDQTELDGTGVEQLGWVLQPVRSDREPPAPATANHR
jgi:hypothetical protein